MWWEGLNLPKVGLGLVMFCVIALQVDTSRASFLTGLYLSVVGYMRGLAYASSFCLSI